MTCILKSREHYFPRLDLSDAYLQDPLDKESQRLTMINTHQGLFVYTRLCFVLASMNKCFLTVNILTSYNITWMKFNNT